MHDHHKTDAIFLALAFVGFEIVDAQACRAHDLAQIVGCPGAAHNLYSKAMQCRQSRCDLGTRAQAWERWNRERSLSNLGLALAIVGYLTARDTFWSAAWTNGVPYLYEREGILESNPTLLAQGDLCDDAAHELWVRADARAMGLS